jgi:hypothetical protein
MLLTKTAFLYYSEIIYALNYYFEETKNTKLQ